MLPPSSCPMGSLGEFLSAESSRSTAAKAGFWFFRMPTGTGTPSLDGQSFIRRFDSSLHFLLPSQYSGVGNHDASAGCNPESLITIPSRSCKSRMRLEPRLIFPICRNLQFLRPYSFPLNRAFSFQRARFRFTINNVPTALTKANFSRRYASLLAGDGGIRDNRSSNAVMPTSVTHFGAKIAGWKGVPMFVDRVGEVSTQL